MRRINRKRVWQEGGCALLFVSLLLLIQAVAGDFPLELFRFPLNVLIVSIWLLLLNEFYRRGRESRSLRYLLSMRATGLSLLFLAAIGLVLGLQLQPASASWPVVGMLLFVQSVLALAIRRVCGQKRSGWGAFLLSHAGLWLALVGAFWGAPDREQLRVAVDREVATREAYRPDGRLRLLEYDLRLSDFRITTYADGSPSSFEAEVEVADQVVLLRVNHPYRKSFAESIYLIGYDRSDGEQPRYCILEVGRDPWRGVTAAGIWLMILGALWTFVRGAKG